MRIPNNNYYSRIRLAIKKIVEYMEDERKHWEESDKSCEHIYDSAKVLKDAIE